MRNFEGHTRLVTRLFIGKYSTLLQDHLHADCARVTGGGECFMMPIITVVFFFSLI